MTKTAPSLTRTIIEGTIYSSVGSFLMRGLSAVGYVIVVWKLTLHDYGIVTLLLSFLSPGVAIVLFGFDRIFVSTIAKLRGEAMHGRLKGLLYEYAILVGVLACIFFGGAYLLKGYLAEYYDIYLLQYFWLVALVIGAQLLFNGLQLMLEGNERLKELSILQFLESLVRNAGVIAFVPYLTISNVLIIHAVAKWSAAVVAACYLIPILRSLAMRPQEREPHVLLYLVRAHGKWEIFRNIVSQLVSPLQVWLVKIFVDVESVAVFDFARKIYGFVVDAIPIKGIIFPIISRTIKEKKTAELIVIKAKKYTMLFYAVAYIGAMVILPYVVSRFLPQYDGELIIVYVALLHVFVEGYKIGQSALMYAYDRQRFQFFLSNISIPIQIIFDITLVYFFGVVGMLVSWHLASLLGGIVVDIYLQKYVHVYVSGIRYFFEFDEYDLYILGRIRRQLRFVISRIKRYGW